MLASFEKMEGITKNPDAWNLLGYVSHMDTFPYFSHLHPKITDYLSSQASLASFLLHGHMQITRRCNLENHVKKGVQFLTVFDPCSMEENHKKNWNTT